MKLYLIVVKGKQQGMPIPIKQDLFLLGSDHVCQLRSQLGGVAPRHCALVTRDGRKVFIQDLDGGEATLVNGEMLPPGTAWAAHVGDRLQVGPLEFMIQFNEKQLSQRDLEEWALRCLDVSSEREEEESQEEALRPKHKPTTASAAAQAILDKLSSRRGVVKGRLRVGLEAGVTVVRFNDVHLVDEAEVALVQRELQENLSRPNLRILLDFKNVKRMSSAMADMVFDFARWVRPWGSNLALCRVKPELRGILQALHILDELPHFEEKQSALMNRW